MRTSPPKSIREQKLELAARMAADVLDVLVHQLPLTFPELPAATQLAKSLDGVAAKLKEVLNG